MLLGPNAPITFSRIRSSFIDHTYDFYKPDPFSEYPTVDGHQSIDIYLNAMRQCYTTFRQKFRSANGADISYSDFSYICMHTPFAKMVQKSFYTLVMDDMQAYPQLHDQGLVGKIKEAGFKLTPETQKALEAAGLKQQWQDRCERSLHLSKHLGNIYTGSLYTGLISLVCDDSIDLAGKKVLLFSYGSGCAASMFYVEAKPGYKDHAIFKQTQYKQRLSERIKVPVAVYDQWMQEREATFGKKDFVPQVSQIHVLIISCRVG